MVSGSDGGTGVAGKPPYRGNHLAQVLADRLTTTSPDMLRELLSTFIRTLIGAETDALCGADYGQRSSERTNSRNGYRYRQFRHPQAASIWQSRSWVRFVLPGLAAVTP